MEEYLKQNPITDMIGFGSYNQEPGTFSDDSSLTFCLAEALTEKFDLHLIALNFIRWYKNNFWTARGKVFDIDYNIKFKPAFVFKMVHGAPLQLDLSANFLFNEKFTLGAAYRSNAALSGLVGFQLSKAMFVGYSYDRETTKLVRYNSGSHEFFIMIDLFNKTQKVDTPRFF